MKSGRGWFGGVKALALLLVLAFTLTSASQATAQPDPQDAVDALTERLDAATEQLQDAIDAKVAASEAGAEAAQRALGDGQGALEDGLDQVVEVALASLDQRIEHAQDAVAEAENRLAQGTELSQRAIERAVEAAEAGAAEAESAATSLLEGLLGRTDGLLGILTGLVDDVGSEAAALLRGEQGPLTTVSNILCPTTQRVDDLIQEHLEFTGLGNVTAALTGLVCAIGLIEYSFVTTWRAPDGGEITRVHDATLGVPTYMNVDATPGADLVGTLGFAGGLSFSHITLEVERAPGVVGELPVSVEAVLSDSQANLLDNRHVAVGYDTRHDTAPGIFNLSTPLDSLSDPDGELSIAMSQSGADSIALIGGMFDGTVVDRQDPTDFRLHYDAQAPTWAQITVDVFENTRVLLESNRATRAELTGRITDEGQTDDISVIFEDLPTRLELEVDGDGDRIVYEASDTVDRIDANLSARDPMFLGANHLNIELLDIPESFVIDAGEAEDGGFGITADNPIGQIDMRARSEGAEFPALPDGQAGAILDATGGELGLHVRAFALRELTFSPDPLSLTTRMQGGLPFVIQAELDGTAGDSGLPFGDLPFGAMSVDALIDQMPSELSLALDPEAGAISYQASDVVETLTAAISTEEPILFGANHLDLQALDLPQSFTLAVAEQADGSFGIVADNPIGQIDVRARSEGRQFPEIPAGETGVILDATGGEIGLALRVLELREVQVTPDPLQIHARLQGGNLFTIDAQLDEESPFGTGPLSLNAVFDRMPSEITVGLDPEQDRLFYDASETMDRLEVDLSTPDDVLFGANHLNVRALDIPQSFNLDFGQGGDGTIGIVADNPIGQIDVRARSEGRQFPEIPAGEAGVILDATGGEIGLALRVFQLEQVLVTPDPLALSTRMEGGRLFTIDLQLEDSGPLGLGLGQLTAHAVIDQMPSALDLAFDPEVGQLSYQASETVDRIEAQISTDGELLLNASELSLRALDVPTSFLLGAGISGDRIGFDADNPLGQLDIQARSEGRDFPEIADGEAGAILDMTDGELAFALRAFQLQRLAVSPDPLSLESRMQGGHVFTLDARVDQGSDVLTAQAVLDRMPAEVIVGFDPAAGKLSYEASDPMDNLQASIDSPDPLFMGITEIAIDALDVPEQFELGAGLDGGRIGFAADNPLGQIDLLARSADREFPEIPAGEAGIVLDATDGEMGLALRAFELRRLALTQDPLGIESRMQGGNLFTVQADVDETSELGLPAGDLSLDIVFDRMPGALDAYIDQEAGTLSYAASAEMDRLEATIAASEGILFGLSDVSLRALDIPEEFEIAAGEDADGRIGITADNPIGQLDLRAASPDAEFPEIPDGEAGAILHMLDDEIALAVRAFELRRVALQQDPIGLEAQMQGGRLFTLDVQVDETSPIELLGGASLVVNVVFDLMPSQIDATIDPETGVLNYQASSTMDRFEASVLSSEPLILDAVELWARALDVPQSFELEIGEGDEGGIELAADNPVGQLDIQGRSADRSFPEIPDGEAGLTLDATNDELALALRVFELRRIAVDFEPITLETHMQGGRVFTIDASLDQTDELDMVTGAIDVNAVLDRMPSQMALTLEMEDGEIAYQASDTMDRLTASISSSEPIVLSGNHFAIEALDVPQAFTLGIGQDDEGMELVTDNPIGQLDLQARSDGQAFPEIPAGEAGAILDATNDELALALRVFELERLAFNLDPISLETKMDGGRVFTVDAQLDQEDEDLGVVTGTLSLEAVLELIPSEVALGLDPETGTISYQASDTMDRLEARVSSEEPIVLNGNHFEIQALDVPAAFELNVGQDEEGLELASDNPIGQLDLRARSDGQAFPQIPAGEAGAILDATNDELALALRTFQLQKLGFTLEPIELEIIQEAGRVFTVDAAMDQTDDDTGLPIGTMSIEALLDQLPAEVKLGVDPDNGEISYEASDSMDLLEATVVSPEPILMNGNIFDVTAQQVPAQFSLGISGEEDGGIGLQASDPIGQLDMRARSENRPFPEIPAGEAGAILDATDDELALALRVFELRFLDVSLDPIGLNAHMEGGRVFTVDARLDQEDEDTGLPLPPLELDAVIDKIPDEVSIALQDVPEPPDGPGGSVLQLQGSSPIDFVRLFVKGAELLEGADHVEAEIENLPTNISVALPEVGPLADISANGTIGQLRLGAGDAPGVLPASGGGLNDLFQFRDLPGDLAIGLRLTALRELSVNLDPIELALEQNGNLSRPVDLDAALDVGGTPVTAEGILNRPRDETSMSLVIDPDGGASIVFDNSHNMNVFELEATGLPGIENVDLAFDNLSRQMRICMDPGPGCQRPNPHSLQRYSGPNVTTASVDFDDFGTHGSGSGPAFRTTLNATVEFDTGDPIEISNTRFRNLGFDLVDSNNDHSSNCGTLPRISVFFDSRGHPFVLDLRYPPSINRFRLGSDSNPARARNRLSRLNGWATGFFGCLGGFNQSHAGALSCGGNAELRVALGPFNINILNFLTFSFNVCGGSVSNPQPW